MAYEVLAVVTNEGNHRLAEMQTTGKSFKVKYFSVGDQGHDPADPTIALTPDPAATACNSGLPLVFGPHPVDGYIYTSTFCPTFICRLERGEVVGIFSTICLIAEVVYSPTPGDPDVGTTFLYAYANMPMQISTSVEQREYYLSIVFKA